VELIIIGNILSIVANTISIYATTKKEREKIYLIQSLDSVVFALANLVLMGFSGVVINMLGGIRNFIAYKKKQTVSNIVIIATTTVVVSLLANNRGFLGIFPILATVEFSTAILICKTASELKLAIIINWLLWFPYCIVIHDFVSIGFAVASIVSCTIGIMTKREESSLEEDIQVG
jgi:hypothetical protein